MSKYSWMAPAEKVFTALKQEARFVGGCVRDTLLERLVKDIDVATPLKPEKIIELLEKAGIKVIPTGIKHGTVTAIIDKKPIEITTLRRDEKTDGRHAEVTFTDDWQEDAARRDFTINALYLDNEGNIYDYFAGQEDLQAKIIKFIGKPEERIKEDYLRILRFFRFAAQLETKNLDEKGLAACGKLAENMGRLSGERVQAEMFKILASPNPVYVLELMQREKILATIGIEKPNLDVLKKLIRRENEKEISEYLGSDAVLRLGCLLLLADIDLEGFAARWKLANRTKENLALLLKSIDPPDDEKAAKKLLRKYQKESFQGIIKMALVQEKIDSGRFAALMKLSENWQLPEIPVNGDELLSSGFEPGKNIGKILAELENWWEENDYRPSKVELLSHAKTLIPAHKGW